MKNTPSYIITDDSITIVVNGKPFTATVSNANFPQIKERIINEDFDGIERFFDTGKAVGHFTNGNITVEENVVLYKGDVVNNHVVDRILGFMREGLPYKPLCNFLDKLMENPSRRAVSELYRFLEHKKMPLTPDGNFLAYKSVRADWTDHHTGTIKNNVGAEIPRMDRNLVCDDANIGCSSGYHAGSLEYAKGFGSHGSHGSHLLIVEIDPADVISIPHDCNCQKLRCCFYKVVGTFERPLTEELNTQYSPVDYTEDKQSEDKETSASFLENSHELGFEAGYEDGLSNSGFNVIDAIDAACLEDSVDELEYESGYQSGYDAGVTNRQRKAKIKANAKPNTSPKRDKFGRFAK